MARRPGAGSTIMLAVIFGVVTAVLIWKYMRGQEQLNRAHWIPVVVASVDIKARTKITREMVRFENFPQELKAETAVTRVEDVVDRTAQTDIAVKEQIRTTSLLAVGQAAIPSLKVPDGMRAVTIGGNQISLVAGGVRDGDHVDLIATYTDGRTKQEVTKMIIQNVLVLWVNVVENDPNRQPGNGAGAQTSITLCVRPEQTELVKAAERNGTLSVSLRGRDKDIVSSPGVTPKQLGAEQEESVTVETNADKTPIIIAPPPRPSKSADVEIKIIRSTTESSSVINK